MKELLTFESELSYQDKNYPEYKYGRIIIKNNNPVFQVYNETNIKEVNGFNIKLLYPYDKDYRYGRIITQSNSDKIILYINLSNKITKAGTEEDAISESKRYFKKEKLDKILKEMNKNEDENKNENNREESRPNRIYHIQWLPRRSKNKENEQGHRKQRP